MKGLLVEFCGEIEIAERIRFHDVHRLENPMLIQWPPDCAEADISHICDSLKATMLSKYRRSAAGSADLTPSQIRTPQTIWRAVSYIESHFFLGKSGRSWIREARAEADLSTYLFIWDRFKMITKECMLQLPSLDFEQEFLPTDKTLAIDNDVLLLQSSLQHIARWHIAMAFVLRDQPAFAIHKQHNAESLFSILKTLNSPSLRRLGMCDEFGAYVLLSTFLFSRDSFNLTLRSLYSARNSSTELKLHSLLKVIVYVQNHEFVRFFKEVGQLMCRYPLLCALLEAEGNLLLSVRRQACASLAKSHLKGSVFSAGVVCRWLGLSLDDEKDADWLRTTGLTLAEEIGATDVSLGPASIVEDSCYYNESLLTRRLEATSLQVLLSGTFE